MCSRIKQNKADPDWNTALKENGPFTGWVIFYSKFDILIFLPFPFQNTGHLIGWLFSSKVLPSLTKVSKSERCHRKKGNMSSFTLVLVGMGVLGSGKRVERGPQRMYILTERTAPPSPPPSPGRH